MKLRFICLTSLLFLLSSCSRNAFLIKRKYNKGFYVEHAAKTNETIVIHFPEKKPEGVLIDLPKKRSPSISFKEDNNEKSSVDPVKALGILFPQQKLSKPVLKKSTSCGVFTRSLNSRATDTVAASIAMLVVLVAILALVKTFGLIYTLPVCFIIAFTAVAIFFMIRTHVKY